MCKQLTQDCTRQWGGWDSNPWPVDRKSSTQTALPSSHTVEYGVTECSCVVLCWFQRAALTSQNLTKVTLETFLKWKERKVVDTYPYIYWCLCVSSDLHSNAISHETSLVRSHETLDHSRALMSVLMGLACHSRRPDPRQAVCPAHMTCTTEDLNIDLSTAQWWAQDRMDRVGVEQWRQQCSDTAPTSSSTSDDDDDDDDDDDEKNHMSSRTNFPIHLEWWKSDVSDWWYTSYTVNVTEWPYLRWSAVKRVLTHSL